ncbi:MAG: carbon starvation protein A [Polyangiaceae bacterium UTPRO1]|jgi:carbon starvation protein|nr:carbon starvation protein A [Myxococcales bacterium]OQY69403.1 MAG: carbon starvation protein A [Polyangiaceae bacterium UTPRO1]
MSLPLLAFVFLSILAAAYLVYGRFVASQYALDDRVRTPAVALADGIDYVPTAPIYLMPQHFSAIAAAGPIVGPIVACEQFGWLPCLLWILGGVVFIGAVHDFSALVASVRHRASSVAEIIRENLSRRAWMSVMLFIWLALVYVIVAFTDVTAGTFLGRIEELDGAALGFNAGGAVAFASTAYLLLSVAMGLAQRWWNPPLALLTAIFVPATLAVVWLGTRHADLLALAGANPQKTWGLILLGYCIVASLLPVSLLLQPRGYLGGFVLYLVLAIGTIGIFLGDATIQQPPFKGFAAGGDTGRLFPFLFVTIACGACSGFHGLVCGGTTSKQIAKESDCRPVGYGAMLLEAFVALIALVTIMIVAPGGPKISAGATYGRGIGQFATVVLGKEHLVFATVFGSMAFSTFVFDTLDVATRLGRYIIQELLAWRTRSGAVVATLATIGAPLLFIASADAPVPGRPPTYMAFWTLFGTSNQLLAALTLLGITVWRKRLGKPVWFTCLPMLFVLAITVWALTLQAWSGFGAARDPAGALNPMQLANGIVAVVLLGLAAAVVVEAAVALRRDSGDGATSRRRQIPDREAKSGA